MAFSEQWRSGTQVLLLGTGAADERGAEHLYAGAANEKGSRAHARGRNGLQNPSLSFLYVACAVPSASICGGANATASAAGVGLVGDFLQGL